MTANDQHIAYLSEERQRRWREGEHVGLLDRELHFAYAARRQENAQLHRSLNPNDPTMVLARYQDQAARRRNGRKR